MRELTVREAVAQAHAVWRDAILGNCLKRASKNICKKQMCEHVVEIKTQPFNFLNEF